MDTWPVTDPRKAIPAASFMLAWWQLAGAALVVPKAIIGVTMVGIVPTTTYQALAFDPDGTLPLLGWTRSIAGVYSYSFPQSEYPDELGNPVTLSFIGGTAEAQCLIGANIPRGHHERTGPRAGTVRFSTTSPSVFVEVPDTKTFIVALT
jgi:hypothetical protein